MVETLTKRNSDFVFQVTKLLAETELSAEQQSQLMTEMQEKLLAEQKRGVTAKQLYQTPQTYVAQYIKNPNALKHLHDYAFSGLALDTGFSILMLFGLIFGVTGLFASTGNQAGSGVTSIILIAMVGGALYTWFVLKITPNPNRPKQTESIWIRVGRLLLGLIAWVAIIVVFAFLPPVINPVLSAPYYIVLAGLAFLGYRWNRNHANLPGGFFVISRLSREANQAARENAQK